MTKYKVIYPFADLLDDNYIYSPGDEFPRQGIIVGAERLAELEGSGNKIGKPLIELVGGHKQPLEGSADETPKKDTKGVKKANTAKKTAKSK